MQEFMKLHDQIGDLLWYWIHSRIELARRFDHVWLRQSSASRAQEVVNPIPQVPPGPDPVTNPAANALPVETPDVDNNVIASPIKPEEGQFARLMTRIKNFFLLLTSDPTKIFK
uniref:Uncharacterized protein n=1 Tax=Tetranychus urticae TaxID=32264 RepID=T1KU66_TETUR